MCPLKGWCYLSMTYTCGDRAVKNLQNINHANRGHILQECLGSSDLHIYTPCHHLSVSYQDGRPGCLHFQNVVWWEALHWLEALGHVSLAGCPPPKSGTAAQGKFAGQRPPFCTTGPRNCFWSPVCLWFCNLALLRGKRLTLKSTEAMIVPHQIIWSWYTGRWWMGCYIWHSDEVTGRGPSPPRPLLAVPKCNSPPINGQCTNHRIAV